MQVTIVLEHRFERTPDGATWTQTMFPYSFWQRYLAVFAQVRVVARAHNVAAAQENALRVDGSGVDFVVVPYYLGPLQYLQKRYRVRRTIERAVTPRNAVIIRVPSPIGGLLRSSLFAARRPYGVEVVGDPYDVFAPGTMHHPLRPFFRWWFLQQQRLQCRHACASAYVTEQALQQRYPSAPGAFTTSFSDVELSSSAFVAVPPQPRMDTQKTVLHIGSMAQRYKAQDVLIDAVACCVRDGLDLRLVLVGDGQYRRAFAAQVQAVGLGARVEFVGQVPAGDRVRAFIDDADLFVLPSRVEGLPRALLEAMARGKPCLASNVGGIPELLPAEDLVMPNDVEGLARRIRHVVTDPRRMAEMADRNLRRAHDYHDERLRARRIEFYHNVRERTESWLNRQSGDSAFATSR